jgi:hypothetical protein
VKLVENCFRKRNEKKRLGYDAFVNRGDLRAVRELKHTLSRKAQLEITELAADARKSQAICYLRQRELAYLFNSRLILNIIDFQNHKKFVNFMVPGRWISEINRFSPSRKINGSRRLMMGVHKLFLILRSLYKTLFILVHEYLRVIKNEAGEYHDYYILGHTSGVSQNSKMEKYDFANWLDNGNNRDVSVWFCLEKDFVPILLNWKRTRTGISLITNFRLRVFATIRSKVGILNVLSIFDQILLSSICENIHDFPSKIYFSESSGGIRPLWSYEIEVNGAEVGLVNFSNSVIPRLNIHYEEFDAQIHLYNWSNVFCCTIEQFNCIKKHSISNSSIQLKRLGVPWYRDDSPEAPKLPSRYIAVFDYETFKTHFGLTTLNELGYGNTSMNSKFMLTIVRVARELGLEVLHKPKRSIDKPHLNPDAKPLLEQLQLFQNYHRVDAKTSAVRVIQDAGAVISMPPTTTALIARELGIPSAYFDSNGRIFPNDPALEGIHVASSEDELREWLSSLCI